MSTKRQGFNQDLLYYRLPPVGRRVSTRFKLLSMRSVCRYFARFVAQGQLRICCAICAALLLTHIALAVSLYEF